jgi:hypothetical protein
MDAVLSRAGLALAGILARRPRTQAIAEGCTPVEIYRRVRGMEVGEWRCPACGTTLELHHYPRSACQCGRPFPRRCTGIPRDDSKAPRGCGEIVEPEKWPASGPRGWDEPWHACSGCVGDAGKSDRAIAFHRALPSEDDLANRATRSYIAKPERRSFDFWVRDWLDAITSGKRAARGVWVVGPNRIGKSTGVARLVHRLFVELRRGASLVWVTEGALLEAQANRWSRIPTVQNQAHDLIGRVAEAEILVIDECSEVALTDSGAHYLGELWRVRLGDANKRTIGISVKAPRVEGLDLGTAVATRWREQGETVRLGGA